MGMAIGDGTVESKAAANSNTSDGQMKCKKTCVEMFRCIGAKKPTVQ
ncbi:hypothetical protein BFJ69_g1288 [Fusarium oxysporum]|uniref:Uncharacterized protein n=1 Tax=Fusarium oxysporum TaxID=5507 RepID=A0A420NZH2_FUSOX|nr:hypothetical protein BFJ69_g1288 [Fusarium oxysporum]